MPLIERLDASAYATPTASSLQPCCALDPALHIEYFFDHVRIEDRHAP